VFGTEIRLESAEAEDALRMASAAAIDEAFRSRRFPRWALTAASQRVISDVAADVAGDDTPPAFKAVTVTLSLQLISVVRTV
jgi:hypothetical protein